MSDKSSSPHPPQAETAVTTTTDTGLSPIQAESRAEARLKHLFQFEQALNDLQDTHALLDYLAQSLVEIIGVDHVGIAIAEPNGKRAIVTSEYPPQGSVGYRIDFTSGIAAMLGDKGESIFVDEVDRPDIYGHASVEAMKALGVRQSFFIPFFDWEQKLAGSVGLDILEHTAFEFSPDVRQFALMLMARANAAYQRIQLRQFNTRQRNQLQSITSFSRAILAVQDVSTILSSVLKTGQEIIPLDHISVALLDAASGDLKLRASYRKTETGEGYNLQETQIIPLDNTLAGQVWQTLEPLLVRDIKEAAQRTIFDEDLRAFIVTPIIIQGAIQGLTTAASRTPYAFDSYDLTAFQQMTNQLSVALENMEIYASSEQATRNKALINEISSKLQQQLELEDLLHITATELGKALGARQARIRLNVHGGDKGQSKSTTTH